MSQRQPIMLREVHVYSRVLSETPDLLFTIAITDNSVSKARPTMRLVVGLHPAVLSP